MKKLVKLSISFLLLSGVFFYFHSCQKESVDELNETSSKKDDIVLKKVDIQELYKVKDLDNSLNLIKYNLDIYSRSEINADNDQLILLTDNIIQAVTDSISTYSFRVKTPTDASSTFENFVITKEKDEIKYFLYRFRFNSNNSEDFPFDITCTVLDENQIIEENFNDLNKYVYWTGHCLLDVYPLPYDGLGYQTIWCDEGGSGGTFYNGYGPSDSSSSGDSSTSTNTGSDSSDSSGTSYNTGDVGSTGGGGSTSSSGDGDYIKPVGVNFSYQENVLDALYNSGYYSIQAEEWVLENPIEAKALNNFLLANNNSREAQKFVGQAVKAYLNNEDVDFKQFYSTQFINGIKNPITGAKIELYYMAVYNSNQILNTSLYSISANEIQVGDYYLKPHYGIGNKLVFYLAYRLNSKGEPRWEYVIEANELNSFKLNIKHYTTAANLFFFNGTPSLGQIKLCAGNYWGGLATMWNEAVHSPEWWIYAITSFGTAIVNLPAATPVGSAATATNWRVPLNKMTSEMFQGKVVTNPQGVKVTINIPDNYVPSIANNGQGINFRPNPPVGTHPDAGVIRVMQPTQPGATYPHPKGYVKFYNELGQPINPINGATLSDAVNHFDFP